MKSPNESRILTVGLAEAIEILPLEEPAAEWKERRRQTVEESE